MVTYGQCPRVSSSVASEWCPRLAPLVRAFATACWPAAAASHPSPPSTSATAARASAASVTGFEPTAWIPPMKLRRMDDTARYAVVATRQAFEDASYPLGGDGDDHAGVIMGTFTAGGQATSEYLRALHAGGPAGAPAILFNSTVANAPASLAALEFKLRGPNVTISQKESSGLAAIVSATDAIRLGRAPALAAGGVDAIFDIFFRVHSRFGVMADGDAPGPVRPAPPWIRPRRGRLCAPARGRDGAGDCGRRSATARSWGSQAEVRPSASTSGPTRRRRLREPCMTPSATPAFHLATSTWCMPRPTRPRCSTASKRRRWRWCLAPPGRWSRRSKVRSGNSARPARRRVRRHSCVARRAKCRRSPGSPRSTRRRAVSILRVRVNRRPVRSFWSTARRRADRSSASCCAWRVVEWYHACYDHPRECTSRLTNSPCAAVSQS